LLLTGAFGRSLIHQVFVPRKVSVCLSLKIELTAGDMRSQDPHLVCELMIG
jgi:hypothetical protein